MDLIVIPEDLTPEEKTSLEEYISNGLPGIMKADDDKVFRWFELYMAGKSYTEIANQTKDKKDLILYIAHRAKWHEKRMEYYGDMARTLTHKLQKAKLEGATTVTNAITALGKYYNQKFNKYLETNNQDIIEGLDTKTLSQYYKSLEMLDKILTPSKVPKDDDSQSSGKPTVNINVGQHARISQTGDTVDIDGGADAAAGDLLKALSAFQRAKTKDNP